MQQLAVGSDDQSLVPIEVWQDGIPEDLTHRHPGGLARRPTLKCLAPDSHALVDGVRWPQVDDPRFALADDECEVAAREVFTYSPLRHATPTNRPPRADRANDQLLGGGVAPSRGPPAHVDELHQRPAGWKRRSDRRRLHHAQPAAEQQLGDLPGELLLQAVAF